MATDSAAVRRLQRWSEEADPLEQQAAVVLATTLSASRRSLLATVQSVFDVDDNGSLLEATRALLDRPFVERVDEGYCIVEPLAAALRMRFRTTNAQAFTETNANLLAQEQALVPEVADEERWFIRGRIAFYLAALDAAGSADEFIAAFATPPPGDSAVPRSWLADLALRQRDLLEGQTRTLDFFEGFRDYKRGKFASARRRFENVLATHEPDQYRAISLHLWSVLADRDSRRDARLRESVRLSVELGLVENEVMARNTLVFGLLASATRSRLPQISALQEASSLADHNLARAEESHDRFLIAGSRFGMAQARWMNLSDAGTRADRVPDAVATFLLTNLATVVEEATEIHDFETAASAINASASIERDRHRYRQAIDVLEAGYVRWQRFEPPRAARRWAKTAGSMLQPGLPSEITRDIHGLLRRLDRWQQRPDGRSGDPQQ